MEDFEWHDPLLITDASSSLQQQDQTQTHCELNPLCSSETSFMPNQDTINSTSVGLSMFGFSLTEPDLVLCAGSPDITNQNYEDSPDITNRRCEDSPEFLKGDGIDVSLENGIEGTEMLDSLENPAAKVEDICSSFELVAPALFEEYSTKHRTHILSINAGSAITIFHGDAQFSEDGCFRGGDTIMIDNPITGFEEGFSIYQTARLGNFSYCIDNLASGTYMVDLHLAEIVFTGGPLGMRVFDVFLQEEKVVTHLDIYERVGANTPLVISDLRAYVNQDDALTIRFEGVNDSPLVCGISIYRESSARASDLKELELLSKKGLEYTPQYEPIKDIGDSGTDDELRRLQVEYACQQKELAETKRVLEELQRENDLKSKECKEAWKSLKDLQNELMRKSMHVGSLAFAIEGQVKEKGRWFSTLRDLTRKLKILKMDQIKLLEDASLFKLCLEDMDAVGSVIQSKINQHIHIDEDIKTKFLQGVKERKELFNKVLELKGNIRVFCRCRPLNAAEIASGASMAVDLEAAKEGELTIKSNGTLKKNFKFDAVFGPQVDQVDVFEETAPLATSVLDGYNVCIFAYGQTGTGKTFTMEGTNDARGVNYRTLEELFRIIEERKNSFCYELSVSVLEVYNEQIRDLLVSGSQLGVAAKRLEVKQVGEGGHHVPGLVEARVNNVSEVWEVLQTGSIGRAVGSTNANEHSSRSHCMHCVMVKAENLLTGECTRSKLWLVDLAGSERVAKTEVQGERLKETQNINRSLSALGDVISALATKSPHIPFRNSKLTHLLQDSLGGGSKTLMFVQISPNENDLTETLCSLNFASRVKGIELGPAKKLIDSSEILKYKQTVEKLRQDLKSRDFQVKKLEDTNYGLEVKLKDRDVKNRNLQEKIKELESQLLVERKLARQHVDSRIAEQQQKRQQEEPKCENTRAPLATKLPGVQRASGESKDQVNFFRPSTENHMDVLIKYSSLEEKENNPLIAEQLQLPNRTGRASLCAVTPRISAAPASRRTSMIPLPGSAKLPSSFLPLTPIQADRTEVCNEVGEMVLPEQTPCASPKEHGNGSKKLSSALRRSLHKKTQIKSPMQQHIRRVGVNVGMEKVRVSIGSRGRMGNKVFLGNASRRPVTKDSQQKKNTQKEKERGWNFSTAPRAVL